MIRVLFLCLVKDLFDMWLDLGGSSGQKRRYAGPIHGLLLDPNSLLVLLTAGLFSLSHPLHLKCYQRDQHG